jgi:DNA-binding ferritin-like protein
LTLLHREDHNRREENKALQEKNNNMEKVVAELAERIYQLESTGKKQEPSTTRITRQKATPAKSEAPAKLQEIEDKISAVQSRLEDVETTVS